MFPSTLEQEGRFTANKKVKHDEQLQCTHTVTGRASPDMEPHDKGQPSPLVNHRRALNCDLDDVDSGVGEPIITQM